MLFGLSAPLLEFSHTVCFQLDLLLTAPLCSSLLPYQGVYYAAQLEVSNNLSITEDPVRESHGAALWSQGTSLQADTLLFVLDVTQKPVATCQLTPSHTSPAIFITRHSLGKLTMFLDHYGTLVQLLSVHTLTLTTSCPRTPPTTAHTGDISEKQKLRTRSEKDCH